MQTSSTTADGSSRLGFSELLRWAGVLPAAAMGAMVVHMTTSVMGMVLDSMVGTAGGGAVGYWVKFAMYYLPAKAGFVICGALMAPRYRLATAVVLATVASGMSLVVHVLGQRSVGATNYSHFAAETAGAVCGVICVAIANASKRPAKMRQEAPT